LISWLVYEAIQRVPPLRPLLGLKLARAPADGAVSPPPRPQNERVAAPPGRRHDAADHDRAWTRSA
jgi:hypothetical protein